MRSADGVYVRVYLRKSVAFPVAKASNAESMILPDDLADLDTSSLVNKKHGSDAMGARSAYVGDEMP